MRNISFMVSGFFLTTLVTGLVAQESGPSTTIKRLTSQGSAEEVGTVSFRDSQYGMIIEPKLEGLPPGPIGVHVHENPSCAVGENGAPGIGAGSHYDPLGKGQHMGPYGDGHLGDLPNMFVEQDGTVNIPVLAPRLRISDLVGRSLMIHASRDDYHQHADHNHGAGGARAYCGIID